MKLTDEELVSFKSDIVQYFAHQGGPNRVMSTKKLVVYMVIVAVMVFFIAL